MAQLTVEDVSLSGATPNLVAAGANGDSFANDGRTVFRVDNAGASSVTVTVDSPTPCNYGYTHNVVATVAAGATEDLGPFPSARFNDDKNNVNVTYSGVTSVTVSPIRA